MTVFVLLIAVTQAAYAVTRAIPFVPEGYDPSLVGAWAGALMLLVLFFLLVRTATLYDRALRKQYADVGEGRPLRFLLCSVRFWAETAAFALLFLLLPLSWLDAALRALFPNKRSVSSSCCRCCSSSSSPRVFRRSARSAG